VEIIKLIGVNYGKFQTEAHYKEQTRQSPNTKSCDKQGPDQVHDNYWLPLAFFQGEELKGSENLSRNLPKEAQYPGMALIHLLFWRCAYAKIW